MFFSQVAHYYDDLKYYFQGLLFFSNHLFKEAHKQKLCTWNTLWSILNIISKMPVLKAPLSDLHVARQIIASCEHVLKRFSKFGTGLWSPRPFHTAHIKLLTWKTNLSWTGLQNQLSCVHAVYTLLFPERWNSCRRCSPTECYAKAVFEHGNVGHNIRL